MPIQATNDFMAIQSFRYLFDESDYTDTDIAFIIGVHKSTLSRMMNDKTKMSLEVFFSLCLLFEIKVII